MSLSEVPPAVKIRYCPNCRQKLDSSIPLKDPRCRNAKACNARAEERRKLEPKVIEPPPPGVVRKYLLQITCDQYGTVEAELVSNLKGAMRARARNAAAYLLVNDLKLTQANAGKVIGRDGSFVKDALEVVALSMSDYRHDLTVVRTKLVERIDQHKNQAA
ncbi:MAG TPA: hypothetical protein VN665_00300 [Candidatus Paceibacterota bacterium]|nr:hypothetical protein [Candidatus Paceibacterota bacterium]